MTRKEFIGLSAALPAAAQAGPNPQPAGRKPNILILMSDQHRPDYLTCAGNDIVPTPEIDRIAARGVRTHGFHYHLGFNDWFMYLGPKVQHYADEIANHPIGPQFFNTVHDDGSGLPELPGLWRGKSPWAGKVKRMKWVGSELPVEDQFDAFVARESIDFMRRYKDQPWLLVAGFLRPHPPLHPPQPWAAKYPVERMEIPAPGDASRYPKHVQRRIERMQALGPERLRAHRAGYRGNLAYVDTCIGQTYRALEELGVLENTIVIYTSDHGEMEGDHGMYQKFCLFTPSVGVPLIVSWPKVLPEGKVSEALVEYFGIYPTIAELSGTPAKTGLEARSFAPMVRDAGARGPDACFSEFALRSRQDCYMIRTRRYKYIYNHNDVAELYDLEADPGELKNLAGTPGARRVEREHAEQLRAWYDPAKNPYRPVA
ncbi:MAG: sulfatase-like hydrolase/transferase [Acidobacteria bacterium]|nr:sulfatase-like hydrolase/transferase [Acidobacteriota bacterium]